MPNFGKKASEYEKEREAASDEVWIKGFRDGETRIRFLDEPDDFVTYREHYEEAIGYFPCSEESDCVGCKDDSAKVRDRSRKFAFHALNSENSQQVFKVGSRLQRTLKSKAQRLGTICDRDYTVIRSGKGMNEITYDLESGDKYDTSYDPKSEPPYDIGGILNRRYADAVEAYTGEKDDTIPKITWHGQTGEGEGEEKKETKSESAKEEKKDPPKEEEKPAEEAKQEALPDDKPADEAQSERPSGSYPNPEDMTRPELAEWLGNPPNDKDGNKMPAVEFPANAPRSRLVKMVRDWQAANPPF